MGVIEDIFAEREIIDQRYRFSFEIGNTVTWLENAPAGFLDGTTQIVRNKLYRGLFRSLVVDELTFITNGRELLKQEYNLHGVDADVTLIIEKKINGVYSEFARLKLDFGTYKEDNTAVKIQAIDSSIIEKVKNREDLTINLNSTTSIDGNAIAPITLGLHFPDTSINNNADWLRDLSGNTDAPSHVLPITLNTSDFPEAKTPSNIPNSKEGACFYESGNSRTITFTGNVVGNIQPKTTGTANPTYELVIDIYDLDGNKTFGYRVGIISGTSGNGTVAINFDVNQKLTINEGDSVVIQANWWLDSGNTTDYECVYQNIDIKLNETYIGTPDTVVPAISIYDAINQSLQILTGENNIFTSTFFTGISGHLIKGRALRTNDKDFPIKLKDLILSLIAIYNIGMGYENGKFVIEHIEHFYGTTGLDLQDRVPDDVIEREAAPDLVYKNIKIGYAKFGKDKDNSGYEYNTLNEYSTEINSVNNSLQLVSKIRADSNSIIRLINDKDLSKNLEGDNDIYLIESYFNNSEYYALTGENLAFIKGAVYAAKSFNLTITPARMLYNWGEIVTVGQASGSVIRWQHTEGNIDLCTRKQPDDDVICERSDFNYLDLPAPLYKAERVKFKCYLTDDEINTIFNSPNLIINFGNAEQGWIEKLTINNDSNESEFILIKQ